MQIADRLTLEWQDFADLPATLLYDLLRFRQAIFVVEQECAYPDLDGNDQRAHHLLLQADGVLAGCLRLIPYPDERRIAIGRVAVAAEWRRQGLAGALMAQALARSRRDYPAYRVTVSAQTYLTAFYANLGFRPASPPYDDYGVPHIDMAL